MREVGSGAAVAGVAGARGLADVHRAAEWAAAAGGACALDAEWAPYRRRQGGRGGEGGGPVALVLQLAFSQRAAAEGALVFVVDLLGSPPERLRELGKLLAAILADARLAKLGFGFPADLEALSRALCECQACASARDGRGNGDTDRAAVARQHLDLAGLAARNTMIDLSHWGARPPRGGLAGLVLELLGQRLDKSLQTSDWSARPLSAGQIQYAASDAAVLLDLLGALLPNGDGPLEQRARAAQTAASCAPTEGAAGGEAHTGGAQGLPGGRKTPGKGPISDAAALRRRLPWGWGSGGGSIGTAPAAAAKFVCCETVEGLGRQLRLVGMDALSTRANCPAGQNPQRWMMELAEAGDRLILTCDRRFYFNHCADLAYFVRQRGKQQQLREVVNALQLEVGPVERLPRCLKCNGKIRLLSPEEAAAGGSEAYQRAPQREYWECSGCRHIYWKGHTYHRAIASLGALVASLGVDDSCKTHGSGDTNVDRRSSPQSPSKVPAG